MTVDTEIDLEAAGVLANLSRICPDDGTAERIKSRLENSSKRDEELLHLRSDQSDVLEGLLAAKTVGWTSKAGEATAALVEAGSGARIQAFDGRAIGRNFAIDYAEVEFPWAEFLGELADFEGYYPYMYLDINSFVTVAIGQMMPNADAAVALNNGDLPFFKKSDGTPASDAEVRTEYAAVAALTDLASRGAGAFESKTTLEVKKPAALKLLEAGAESHVREALNTGKYPGFKSYPAGVQKAITDMAFNLGVPKFIRQYISFRAAILNRDWKRAKAESGRRGLGRRNVAVAAWFDPAIAAERYYLALAPKGSSQAPEKIVTLGGSLAPA